MKIGINGAGRIGRLVIRAALGGLNRDNLDPNKNLSDFTIAHVNEMACPLESTAHLLEFDSIHGKWDKSITHDFEKKLFIDKSEISYTQETEISDVKWGDLGCDIVIDCTGNHKEISSLKNYFKSGVKKVLVSAPIDDPNVLNLVYGINHEKYDPKKNDIITAASCTTNCLAPIIKVIHENIGIQRGQITTIHNPTNTNTVIDKPHKDLRRARSSLISLQPTTTGSATAIGLIYPELEERLNGHAVRVPVLNASLTDCVLQLESETNKSEINELFRIASQSYLKGILGFENRPLVSSDYTNDTRSSIIDGLSTLITDNSLLKVYAWYDNEVGYACRMLDLVNYIGQ